jgi:hypothetical protein
MPLRFRAGAFFMTIFNRRGFGVAAVATFAVIVGACGDPEPEQRKAFIAFLQKMIDRPGVHVMNTLPDDEIRFGDYTKHYAVFLDFNKEMSGIMETFSAQMKQLVGDQTSPRNIEQLVAHRADVVAVRDGLGKSQDGMREKLATARATRTKLQQPADLKKVYDAAFDKIIVQPVQGVEKVYAVLSDGIKATLQLIDYAASHRSTLIVNGSQVQAKDARTLAEVNELLKAHNVAGMKLNDAKNGLRKIMEGS